MEKIRVIIAEDSEMFRTLLSKELNRENIEIVGTAEDGLELIELVKKVTPDIVLLDLSMPKLSGEEVLKVFKKDYAYLKTIVLSQDSYSFYVTNVILDGARAYLSKDMALSELLKAIDMVHTEGFYFNELVSRDILAALQDKKGIHYLIGDQQFSSQEIEVMQRLCDSFSPEQIADELEISANTVIYHKNKLFKRTGSDTTVELVRYAIRNGIVRASKPIRKFKKN